MGIFQSITNYSVDTRVLNQQPKERIIQNKKTKCEKGTENLQRTAHTKLAPNGIDIKWNVKIPLVYWASEALRYQNSKGKWVFLLPLEVSEQRNVLFPG